MITLKEVKAVKDSIFGECEFEEGFKKYTQWLTDNDGALDPEAKKYSDAMFDNFFKTIESKARQLPDTPENRRSVRSTLRAQGKHQPASDYLKLLEMAPQNFTADNQEWSDAILIILQNILDFLFDVRDKGSLEGVKMVSYALFCSCFDELISALHLSRHQYFGQSNTHLRSILETLDRIDLFNKDPGMLKIWHGDDEGAILKELTPSTVRKKLGKPKFDPIYGFLCDTGAHPTFRNFQGRTVISADEAKNKTALIFIGGTRIEHVQITNFQLSMIIGNLLLNKIVGLYGSEALNFEGVEKALKENAGRFQSISKKLLLPLMERYGKDTAEFLKALSNLN
jgi:hypothetical protein